jgi:hypothetical protein
MSVSRYRKLAVYRCRFLRVIKVINAVILSGLGIIHGFWVVSRAGFRELGFESWVSRAGFL